MSTAVAAPEAAPPREGVTYLTAHISRDTGQVMVRLAGSLSGPRVPLLETVIHRLEKRPGRRLALDLRGLWALDGAGAALIGRSSVRALRRQTSLTIIGSTVPR